MDKKLDEAGRPDMNVPSVQDIMGKKLPEKKFRAGPVSATIWVNHGKDQEGKETTYKTISFERSYMDKEGNWQTTNSLRTTDLPKAVLVLNKAYEYLSLTDGEQHDED
ncbi:hypothetical protein KO361_05515 [Candidatus Woesearchaeota archaeon]|nr:hypothetical protein [Candidatus Woesearchaeota archaeon]